MDDVYFRRIMTGVFLIFLVVLSFFVLKSVLFSIIVAMILAFVFAPLYDWLYKHTNSKNISAGLIVLLLIIIIILPTWFLTPIMLKQSFSIFQATQQIDFVTPLKSIFPSFFASEEFSAEIGSILSSFTSRVANSLVNSFSQIILNFPKISLQLLVVFFTFFFLLKEKKTVVEYVQSLLPFSKEIEKKIFDYSKGITASVLYGQVVIGIIQGLIVGLGFFIFGVPNALFFTLLAAVAGILPIVGTTIVWAPVAIYLFIAGNNLQAWGVIIFGLVASVIDNFLRPIIVSRRIKIHSAIILISMIGGFFFLGILGFIIGPLIISYLLILLEIYRGRPSPGILVREKK